VQHFLFVGQFSTIDYVCAVGDDLVYVHVALGSRSGLPDHQGKFSVQLTGKDLITHFGDEVFFVGRKNT
jgi:hypothetical protein